MRRALSQGPPDPPPAPDRRLGDQQLQGGAQGVRWSWMGLREVAAGAWSPPASDDSGEAPRQQDLGF